MKKVLNWTIGSFFRTIGRTIAFLVMGGLIYYILTYNGIGITDLFFDKVKASSYDGVWVPWATYSEDEGQTWNNTTFSNDKYHGFLAGLNGTKTYMIKFNQSTSLTNAKDIKFNIKTKVNSVNSYDISLTESQYTCNISGTYHEYSFPSGNPDIEFEYNSFKCNAHNITGYADLNEHKVNITLMYFYNDNVGLQAPCYATSQSGSDIFSFTCPVVSTASTISGVVLLIQTNMQSTLDLGVNYLYTIEKDTTQSIIDNQNQNTQQIIEQQQNSTEQMLDSNTTEAEEEATSFFEDFDVPDVGGLSAIITAPLNTIRSLLNSSCTNLSVPLPYMNNKYLTLPCMGPIYTEHFGLFFTLYQTIILAIISYRCIRSIYFDIHGFTDPSDDRIEVMDL